MRVGRAKARPTLASVRVSFGADTPWNQGFPAIV